jgi:hypothetical protein
MLTNPRELPSRHPIHAPSHFDLFGDSLLIL